MVVVSYSGSSDGCHCMAFVVLDFQQQNCQRVLDCPTFQRTVLSQCEIGRTYIGESVRKHEDRQVEI